MSAASPEGWINARTSLDTSGSVRLAAILPMFTLRAGRRQHGRSCSQANIAGFLLLTPWRRLDRRQQFQPCIFGRPGFRMPHPGVPLAVTNASSRGGARCRCGQRVLPAGLT